MSVLPPYIPASKSVFALKTVDTTRSLRSRTLTSFIPLYIEWRLLPDSGEFNFEDIDHGDAGIAVHSA